MWLALVLVLFAAAMCAAGQAQGVEVTATVVTGVQGSGQDATSKANRKAGHGVADAVVWLTPVGAEAVRTPDTVHAGPYRLVQKGKEFLPHVLAVPMGSSVEFPNHDPFFHNVFSLFNGKRFDLGLYESGTSRSVRFDREGVSYIFCNIHPEMGAVVLAMATPYYAVSGADGAVVIRGVPAGSYRVHVWSEKDDREDREDRENGRDAGALVQVGSAAVRLGIVAVRVGAMPRHTNKFGEEYPRERVAPY
jgi:plastocyanin